MKIFVWLFLLLFCCPVTAAELLIFTAEWCEPCRQFKADYAKDTTIVAPYEKNTAVFDIEKNAELAQKYNVKTVPAFLVVEKDVVLRKQEGYNGPVKLKKWLENNSRTRR